MVDKTPLEIKQDNATAQLNVIKGNIQTANDELSGLLSNKETIESELGSLKEESVRISELNIKADKERQDKDDALEAKRIAFEQQVEDFKQHKEDFDIYVKDKENEIEESKASFESTILVLNEEIDKLKSYKSTLQKQLEETKQQVFSVKEELISVTSEKNRLDSELVIIKDEHISFINKSSKEKEYILNELETIKASIEEEKDKIRLPFELHNKRVAELDRRENNFNILFARFKREFKKLYPNQEPKI